MLKWFMRPADTSSLMEGPPKIGCGASRSPGPAMEWNMRPALSSSVIRPSRSSTRWSTGRDASR